MKHKFPYYYKEFSCIGGACKDSCCIGWEIDIDDDSYDYYNKVEGAFGARLRNSMNIAGEHTFTLKENHWCPFLNQDKLCDIFIELGEESLCKICTEYPRYHEMLGNYVQSDMSLSCMEVGKIFFKKDTPITYETIHISSSSEELDLEEKAWAEQLLEIQDTALHCMQNRKHPWKKRAAYILEFLHEVQEKWNEKKLEDIHSICKKYKKSQWMKQTLNNYSSQKEVMSYTEIRKKYQTIFKTLDGLEVIDTVWRKELIHIKDAVFQYFKQKEQNLQQKEQISNKKININAVFSNIFDVKIHDKMEIWYEHLMVYFLFRYMLRSFYDNNLFEKGQFAVMSCLVLECMDYARWLERGKIYDMEDRIDVAHLYSKEVEHSEENLQYLSEEFLFEETYHYQELRKLLL